MKLAFVGAVGCAILFSTALPAAAIEANYSAASASSADAVWAKVGDFCGISKWLPLKCVLSADGKTRTLTTEQGGVVVEQLDSRDDNAHTYTYSIISAGPLPVANYRSTIAVNPAGTGSAIVWTGKFDAKGASDPEAKKAIEGIYKAGADALAK